MKEISFHEDFGRDELVDGPTDRGFGIVVGAACLLIGAGALWLGRPAGWWWCGIGGALLLLALARPKLLRPLNRLWLKLGLLLFVLVNPVVMAVLYYLCIVPMGLLMRAVGKDPLSLRRDPAAQSYWRLREPAAPASMRNQF